MRLNKFLSSAGIAARRKCDEYIFEGKVKVNGETICEPGYQVSEKDEILIGNKPVSPKNEHIYIVMNKPRGYVTTLSDEKGRKKVTDLIDIAERIYPVGRLDMNSTGVLLFMNDGELTHRLSHPKYGVTKTYRVKTHRAFDNKDLLLLEKGVKIKSGDIVKGKARIISPDRKHVEIKIKEGKKHQVKLMMESLGYIIESLDRIRYGNIKKSGLAKGMWRFLKKSEVERLQKLVGL